MTPFIDEVGAEIVLNLFHQAHVPTRCLILRAGPDGKAPPALAVIRPHLDALGVSVLNARLGKSEGRGRETFHAKVVLADDAAAYVGSSNMLRSSFTSSLELGLYVRGEAAKRVADVLRAVISVAPTMMN